jgi:hypothetical protein
MRSTRFIPGLERLEERAVPAVTASLAAGILTINGTAASDSIVLHQTSGKVTIDGVRTAYAAAALKSIVINAGNGNDAVSLVGLAKQPWNKPITVTSTGGNDVVKLLDGSTLTLSGANQRLTIGATSGAALNGKAVTWFDANIHDAALLSLLKTDYADKSINRTEMLAVFKQVEKDGTVTATEFNDLKAVANNAALFGGNTYVVDLTHDVVLGNAANAHYQGGKLGNLTAGSSAGQLDKLVSKWFLGADHPDAQYSGISVTYATASGQLFGASGPQYIDVHQGAVGDCYFVATLGEIALKNPSQITTMFVVNGDGTYGVRFYENGVAHYVTVDSQLPTYGGGYFLYANMGSNVHSAGNVLWVALAEKAYAQMNEAGWLRPAAWGGGHNSYAGIEGGLFSDVAKQMANLSSFSYQVHGTADATTLQNAVTAGKLIGFASVSSPTNPSVVGNHQYVVISYNSSTQTVTLFNPWGINNGSQYPGLLSLNLSQLAGNFSYWTVA